LSFELWILTFDIMLSKKQDLLAQNKKYGKQKYTTNAAKNH